MYFFKCVFFFFFFYSFINLRNVCFLCSHSFSPRQFSLSGDNKSNLDFYHFSHLHLFPHFSVVKIDLWILTVGQFAFWICHLMLWKIVVDIFSLFSDILYTKWHLIKKTISRLTHYVYLQKCSTHTQTGPRYWKKHEW